VSDSVFADNRIEKEEYVCIPIFNEFILSNPEFIKIEDACQKYGCFIAGSFAKACSYHGRGIKFSENNTNSENIDLNMFCPSDIDIFCQSQESFDLMEEFITKHYQPDIGSIINSGRTFSIVNSRPWNVLEIDIENTDAKIVIVVDKIQLVRPSVVYGSRIEVMDNFDLPICRYSILDKETLLVSNLALASEANRIVFADKKLKNPVKTLFRMLKYSRKGYTISGLSVLNLVLELKEFLTEEKESSYKHYISNIEEAISEENGPFSAFLSSKDMENIYSDTETDI